MLSGLTAVSEIDGLPVKKINFGPPVGFSYKVSHPPALSSTGAGHRPLHAITVLAVHLEVKDRFSRATGNVSVIVRHLVTKSHQHRAYKNVWRITEKSR
jgi:hypothetical protein